MNQEEQTRQLKEIQTELYVLTGRLRRGGKMGIEEDELIFGETEFNSLIDRMEALNARMIDIAGERVADSLRYDVPTDGQE